MFVAQNLISLVSGFVDRAIGAAHLSPSVREKLLLKQLAAIARTTPFMMAAACVVSTVMLIVMWNTTTFWATVALIVPITLLHGYATYLAISRYARRNSAGSEALRAVTYSLLLGILWAFLLGVLPQGQAPAIENVALFCAGGLLCISILALVNYPQALAAFTIPLIIGALAGYMGMGQVGNAFAQILMLTGLTCVMVVTTLNHASAFVAFRASEMLVQEKGEIIGLLLREFEQVSSDWIWGIDHTGRVNRMSGGFTRATGVADDELNGADFVFFLRCITPPGDPLVAQIERDIANMDTFQDIELCVTADGRNCWWTLTGKPVFDEAGEYQGYLGIGSDITERKVAERRITTLAHHDSMTGLINRMKFTEQLGVCVARLERYGTPFSLMFLDLDQFKAVNDTKGHMVGDKLLFEVAGRLKSLVRETDLTARLGGDEFAILLQNEGDADVVRRLAGRVTASVREPFRVDGDEISVGVSVGIAMAPVNGTRPDQILRNADLALYRAKADGRSVFRFFESQMDSEARERRLLEAELRDAIANRELVLHYQPLVSAQDEKPMGFEALIRWNHPIRGLVAPAEFIPIAEQSSLIVEIGNWTIHQACMMAATWPDHLTVAVNLSAKHFRNSDISLVVKAALAQSGLAPNRLEIEITEGLLIEEPDAVVEKLAEIRALGVTIAMDDFGTGYSSLSYLLKFPFDKIKIDRSFVEASTKDAVARDILRAIASLGKTLKVRITAEGVETAAQAAFLSEIACHQLQGFHFARPLDAIELPQYLLSTVTAKAADAKAEAVRALAG